MKAFWGDRIRNLAPYTPGEQPRDRQYIKLNTNENPYSPAPSVLEAVQKAAGEALKLYPDPNSTALKGALAAYAGLRAENVFVGNGSDEVLALCFAAFFDKRAPVRFPDVTYSFYPVYADFFSVPYEEMPVGAYFDIRPGSFAGSCGGVILPNPNAPTGYVLPISEIERMAASDPNRLVLIDEAYVDYGNETCIPLIHKYKNLIVVHTMSKSKNLAGAHIGYCVADKSLIDDLNGIKFSFNPFNMSDISLAIGTAAVKDSAYYEKCAKEIIANREFLSEELRKLGFQVLESHTNFIFVTNPAMYAKEYNQKLREHGILARYYDAPRIDNFLRITIGTREEMEAVVEATREILQKLAA